MVVLEAQPRVGGRTLSEVSFPISHFCQFLATEGARRQSRYGRDLGCALPTPRASARSVFGRFQRVLICMSFAANELGVQTAQQYHKGKKVSAHTHVLTFTLRCVQVLDFDGRVLTYTTDIPLRLSLSTLLSLQWLFWLVDRMRKRVPLDKPHTAKHASQWDATTVADFMCARAWTK